MKVAAEPPPVSYQTPIKCEASPDFTIFDLPERFFQPPPPKRKPQPSVHHEVTKTATAGPVKPQEKQIEKSQLNEEALAKWNLFEKTFSVSLGEQTTKSFVMASFRRFLKTHHPDLNGQASAAHNFSTLVKIKDEFIKAIK